MKKYESVFKESAYDYIGVKNKIAVDVAGLILETLEFSPKTVATAYGIADRINKIIGKDSIEPYKYMGDTTKESMLKNETWIEMFYNTALFNMLNVKELNEFAKQALDDRRIKYKLMRQVYDKKPRDLKSLLKIISTLK